MSENFFSRILNRYMCVFARVNLRRVPPDLLSGRTQTSNPILPKSLPQLITASVNSCDPDIRQVLLSNVVLCGGGSLFSGLADRLSNELNRAFNHVGLPSFPGTHNISTFSRLKSTPPGTQLSDATVVGLAGAFLRVWVRSISFG